MVKFIRFFAIGILMGIVLTKSEAISWYRIQEMFRFQSFHMYGIIGSAVGIGALVTYLIKKYRVKDYTGNSISFNDKDFSISRYLFGGIIFGLGWALTGACPGPIYTLIGNEFGVFVIVLISAVFGTFLYGVLRDRLPH